MAKTHRMTGTSEHKAWGDMKSRCFNPNHKRYADWGGRGITVCDRWKNSFENFFADMGLKPTSRHSIDRINNDGDYCPENCKWSTRKNQQNNRRGNHLIIIKELTFTIAEWTEKKGYKTTVIIDRLQLGWSEYDAVMTPIHISIKNKLIKIESKTLTIAQWSKERNIKESVINDRLKYGWSEFDAVMTPVRKRKTA